MLLLGDDDMTRAETGGMQQPGHEEVAAFLAQRSGGTAGDLEPLTGGAVVIGGRRATQGERGLSIRARLGGRDCPMDSCAH